MFIVEEHYVKTNPVLYVTSISSSSPTFVINEDCSIFLNVICHLVEPVRCKTVVLALAKDQHTHNISKFNRSSRYSSDSIQDLEAPYNSRPKHKPAAPESLEMAARFVDDPIQGFTASLVCGTELKRSESYTSNKGKETPVMPQTYIVSAQDVVLKNGENSITLTGQVSYILTLS